MPKDPAAALNLYRKAAGIEGSVNLDGAPPAASREELDQLRKELERARQDLEKARRELDQQRLKSSQEIERLTQQKLAAAAAGNADETRRLEAQLKARESELENRRQQVARFERANEDYKARLVRMEGESAALRQELGARRERRAPAGAAGAAAQRRASRGQRRRPPPRPSAASPRCSRSSRGRKPPRHRPIPAASRRSRRSSRRAATEFARQKQEITRLEADVAGYKATVAKLETKPSPEPKSQNVSMAPPSIQIIDPPVVITRDTATVKVRSGRRRASDRGPRHGARRAALVHRQRRPPGGRCRRHVQDDRQSERRTRPGSRWSRSIARASATRLEFLMEAERRPPPAAVRGAQGFGPGPQPRQVLRARRRQPELSRNCRG